MSKNILEILKRIIASPDLASKKWVYEQYDSHVMNDTIATNGDASIVRVRGTNKALALTSDCTPRYVVADPELGAMQAVCETYRNISATGAKPLAITNCLNFGNPEKPQIMGQIVRAIKGINKACQFLNYPVVSGNVSLYNETDGNAILPTPTIGGVGLLKDLSKRAEAKFKNIGDEIFVIGEVSGHLDCSIYQRDILQILKQNNPPQINLEQERKNSEFIRDLIANGIIEICHDISDGGLLVALFEMCTGDVGCDIDINNLCAKNNLSEIEVLFGEEQSRYIVAINGNNVENFKKIANSCNAVYHKIGNNIANNIAISDFKSSIKDLRVINDGVFDKNFS